MHTLAAHTLWNQWTEGQLEKEQKHERDPDRVEFERRVIDQVRALGLPNGSSILDVGIGAGWITQALYAEHDYTGLDLSEVAIEAAKRRCPGANLMAVDFQLWPAPTAHYDAILCMDTLAYFPHQDAALRKMFHALKHGGAVVLTTVNPFIFDRFAWRKGVPRMGKWLTKSELHALLKTQGFEVEQSQTIVPAGDHGWLRALNSRKLKKLLGPSYVSSLEAAGLGQHRIVVARKR